MFNKNDQAMVNSLASRICEGRGYDPDLHTAIVEWLVK